MSAKRALPETADWRYQEMEENSTATWQVLEGATSGFWVKHLGVGGVWNDPVRHFAKSSVVIVDVKANLQEDEALYGLVDPLAHGTALVGGPHAGTVRIMPPEFELLSAIVHAPEGVRELCLRLLGAIPTPTSAIDTRMEGSREGSAWLSRDADDQAMPLLGDRVTAADQRLATLATSYRREEVALRVPLEDDE